MNDLARNITKNLLVDDPEVDFRIAQGIETNRMVAWNRQFLNQRVIFAHLDQYAKLGLPLNVSEITVAAMPAFGDGDTFQELVAEKLCRLWFSHAATNGIIWWNLVDGTAAYAPPGSEEGENRYRGGLLNYDLSPKPVYTTLSRLIKEEWTSSGTLGYEAGTINQFHGFYGDYELTITTDSGTCKRTIRLGHNAKNQLKVTVSSEND